MDVMIPMGRGKGDKNWGRTVEAVPLTSKNGHDWKGTWTAKPGEFEGHAPGTVIVVGDRDGTGAVVYVACDQQHGAADLTEADTAIVFCPGMARIYSDDTKSWGQTLAKQVHMLLALPVVERMHFARQARIRHLRIQAEEARAARKGTRATNLERVIAAEEGALASTSLAHVPGYARVSEAGARFEADRGDPNIDASGNDIQISIRPDPLCPGEQMAILTGPGRTPTRVALDESTRHGASWGLLDILAAVQAHIGGVRQDGGLDLLAYDWTRGASRLQGGTLVHAEGLPLIGTYR